MQSFAHAALCMLRAAVVKHPERTLAEHGNVPVRCSVQDCATRGDPHMQSCAFGAYGSFFLQKC
jgi:hypothetical protein